MIDYYDQHSCLTVWRPGERVTAGASSTVVQAAVSWRADGEKYVVTMYTMVLLPDTLIISKVR